MGLDLHPAFSRYWIDVVLRPGVSTNGSGAWRPVPFEAIGMPGVGVTRWETLLLADPGADMRVWPGTTFDAVTLGIEPRPDAEQRLDVARAGTIVVAAGSATHYATLELPSPSEDVVLAAGAPDVTLSHLAVRQVAGDAPP